MVITSLKGVLLLTEYIVSDSFQGQAQNKMHKTMCHGIFQYNKTTEHEIKVYNTPTLFL